MKSKLFTYVPALALLFALFTLTAFAQDRAPFKNADEAFASIGVSKGVSPALRTIQHRVTKKTEPEAIASSYQEIEKDGQIITVMGVSSSARSVGGGGSYVAKPLYSVEYSDNFQKGGIYNYGFRALDDYPEELYGWGEMYFISAQPENYPSGSVERFDLGGAISVDRFNSKNLYTFRLPQGSKPGMYIASFIFFDKRGGLVYQVVARSYYGQAPFYERQNFFVESVGYEQQPGHLRQLVIKGKFTIGAPHDIAFFPDFAGGFHISGWTSKDGRTLVLPDMFSFEHGDYFGQLSITNYDWREVVSLPVAFKGQQ